MKNPYVFFGVMAVLLVAGYFVGKNWNTWFPGDVLDETGGPKPDDNAQRVASMVPPGTQNSFSQNIANGNMGNANGMNNNGGQFPLSNNSTNRSNPTIPPTPQYLPIGKPKICKSSLDCGSAADKCVNGKCVYGGQS